MIDRKFRNVNWRLRAKDDGVVENWETLHAALLMDIREELQILNKLLASRRMATMPRLLERIDRRLAKHVKLTPDQACEQLTDTQTT
jgi:hypothetical protein